MNNLNVNLTKGQSVNLTKNREGLKEVEVGLGWVAEKRTGLFGKKVVDDNFDLDVTAFLVTDRNKVEDAGDMIFYNNLEHNTGCCKHMGDDRVGGSSEDAGDSENIIINFTKIPTNIVKVAIVVTIDSYEVKKQNFGQLSKAFANVVDTKDQTLLATYNLTDDFSTSTRLLVVEFIKDGVDWVLVAKGEGYQGGLGEFCKEYGLGVASK